MPDYTSNRFNMLRRAQDLIFVKLGFVLGISRANHCLSWHRIHSTSFSWRKLNCWFPQVRHATRSANLTRPLGITNPARPAVTELSKLNTSTGEITPAFRLTCSSGNGLDSTKSQRTKKSTIRRRLPSSNPEASSKLFADSHLPSGRNAQTASRNISVSRRKLYARQQGKPDVTRLRQTKSHRTSRVFF